MKEIKVKCLSCGSLEGGDFCGSCHTILPLEGEDVDCYELFGLTPRPYVDTVELKRVFLMLSQKLHPDRNMGVEKGTRENVLAVSAQLNRGYTTLTDLKERLRYLVGRETDTEPMEAKQVPAEMMELFFEVHDLMQEVDDYLKQRKPAASRLQVALAMTDDSKNALLARIVDLHQRARQRTDAVAAEVKELDVRWDDADTRGELLPRLTALADMLAYLGRLKSSLDAKELALKT
jgi:curved DNA-binding protein CbpA